MSYTDQGNIVKEPDTNCLTYKRLTELHNADSFWDVELFSEIVIPAFYYGLRIGGLPEVNAFKIVQSARTTTANQYSASVFKRSRHVQPLTLGKVGA